MHRWIKFFLKNHKPQSKAGKTLLWTLRVLSLMALLYLVSLLYPQIFFSYQYTKHGLTVYSHQPISTAVEQRLDEVYEIISKNEIYDPTLKARIFVCNSLGWYRLFFPTFRGLYYSMTRQLLGQRHVFIAMADLVRNKTGSPDTEKSWRSFTGVCAHELFHLLIANAVEKRGYVHPPKWIEEGYCEYASGNISLPESIGLNMILNSPSFEYYKRNKTVKYLIEQKGLDFDSLLDYAKQHNEKEAWQETAQWLKKNVLR